MGLFLVWCHRLICIVWSLCKHACKEICDVNPGKDPYPLLARSCDRWWPDFVTFTTCKKSRFGLRCLLVQSLNSPFFPPHIGAEPGRAKEESRITCMRMLRTNQSKNYWSQPRCSRQCVTQCLFQLALWKKTFSLTLILSEKHKNVKIEICFTVVCTLIDDEYTSLLFCQTLFSYCFSMLSDFAKAFEWKVWRVQVAHLHNAARALSSSSRCFQLSTNLGKDFFRYLWYCDKTKSNVV